MTLRRLAVLALVLCALVSTVAYSQSSIPTANCSFNIFDVGTSGASFANRINRWHTTIGNSESFGNFIRWPNGSISKLVIAVNGDQPSVTARNYYGAMAGFFFDPNIVEHGFVFANGTTTVFDYPGASATELHGLNKYGSMVGIASTSSNPWIAFDYKNGRFTTLNLGTNPIPVTISDTGVIVGTHEITNLTGGQVDHGFVFINGTLQDILFPGADDTQIEDVNPEGVIVGTYHIQQSDGSIFTGSFMIRDGQFYKIAGPGITQVFGINGFNEIVGRIDQSTSTRTHAFVGKCQ